MEERLRFVARLLEGEGIGDALDAMLRSNLPTRLELEGMPVDWRNCPFLPQNGFGAIHANLIDHARLVEALEDV